MISNHLLMWGISMQPCGTDNVCVEWDILPYNKGFDFVLVVNIVCTKVHWFFMDME